MLYFALGLINEPTEKCPGHPVLVIEVVCKPDFSDQPNLDIIGLDIDRHQKPPETKRAEGFLKAPGPNGGPQAPNPRGTRSPNLLNHLSHANRFTFSLRHGALPTEGIRTLVDPLKDLLGH